MDDRFTAKDRVFVEGRSGRSESLGRVPMLAMAIGRPGLTGKQGD